VAGMVIAAVAAAGTLAHYYATRDVGQWEDLIYDQKPITRSRDLAKL